MSAGRLSNVWANHRSEPSSSKPRRSKPKRWSTKSSLGLAGSGPVKLSIVPADWVTAGTLQNTGACVSRIETVKLHEFVWPAASLVTQFTVVTPDGNNVPDGGA